MIPERPRPLILTVDNFEKKLEILENAYKLSHTTEWKNVFIAPDRTPKEREEHKKLREELKRRQHEGEEGIIIRKGKIVKKARVEPVIASASGSSEPKHVTNENGQDGLRPEPSKDNDTPEPAPKSAAQRGSDAPHGSQIHLNGAKADGGAVSQRAQTGLENSK